jgi:Ecdysteroid kinase-like family
MAAIPQSARDISVDWLRASLRAEDAATFSNLISVSVERLGEGVALSTDIYRLKLGYVAAGQPGPATLVAKLPSSSPEVREVARGWSMHRREVLFYRDIAATVPLRTPKTYVAEFDPETDGFVLVMEDLSPARGGNQIAGLPLDHARLALDEVAGLHASLWNGPELAALAATIQPFGEGAWIGTGGRHAAAWPAFETFVAGRASRDLLRVGERMASTIERMMVDMAKPPRTLCHGDFRADNLMFAPRDGDATLITVDWQAPLQARGAFDVGYLMSMSVTTELRRAHESVLLHGYYDRLLAAGVEDYAYDEFFHDYRRGLLIGFTYVVHSGAVADLTNPVAEALLDSAVRRLDAAVQDHGLAEFVD